MFIDAAGPDEKMVPHVVKSVNALNKVSVTVVCEIIVCDAIVCDRIVCEMIVCDMIACGLE